MSSNQYKPTSSFRSLVAFYPPSHALPPHLTNNRSPKTILPNIRELHLGSCSIGDRGCVKLADALKAKGLPNMRLLSLAQNQIGDDGAIALSVASKAQGLDRLTGLYLGRNQIGDRGGAALADALEIHLEGPSLPLLNHLHLFGNAMSSVGKGVLQAAAKGRAMANLDLGD